MVTSLPSLALYLSLSPSLSISLSLSLSLSLSPSAPYAQYRKRSALPLTLCVLSFIQNLSASGTSLLLLVQHWSATHFLSLQNNTKKSSLLREDSNGFFFLVKGEVSGKERSQDVKYAILHNSKGKTR